MPSNNDAGRSLPDKLDVVVRQHEEDAETALSGIVVRSLISSIPFAGGAINEINSGLAQRRAHERIHDVFEAMKERLHELDEKKIDPDYFHSDEFQTVFYLLIERLHTTHQKEKLKIFGTALGNAGLIEFKSCDKEEFVRILRDLSVSDLLTLNNDLLKGWTPRLPHLNIEYPTEILTSLVRLEAMGLVLRSLKMREVDPRHRVRDGSLHEPTAVFRLSPFGEKYSGPRNSDQAIS